jgi:threonine dehydrogenase-like Zn-dependent dehydrogenase
VRALCWHGNNDVRVDTVPDPEIHEPTDAIIKITSTAICGSDLHLYDGFMMGMEKGDVLGLEPMGIVAEVGRSVAKLIKGDRVVVPFVIACGHCFFCTKQLYSCCDTTNPDAEKASKLMGHAPAGLFGYSHLLGGYAGGQAEYLRVPYADVGPIKIESDLSDEKVFGAEAPTTIAWTGHAPSSLASTARWRVIPVSLMGSAEINTRPCVPLRAKGLKRS